MEPTGLRLAMWSEGQEKFWKVPGFWLGQLGKEDVIDYDKNTNGRRARCLQELGNWIQEGIIPFKLQAAVSSPGILKAVRYSLK